MIEDLRRRWPCPFCGEPEAVRKRGTLCSGCEQMTRRPSEAARWEQPPLLDVSPPVPGRPWQNVTVNSDLL